MDKNAIKKYAVWARRELIERVTRRAMIYGITAKDAGDPNAGSVNGRLLTQTEKRQRQALIRNIKEKGYEQVVEEAAYTWFNRFAALRFMEVNGYLPSHIRVFTNDSGEFKPQILAEAIHLEMEGLDMKKVYELENANKSEELFKYLLIVQCNALNSILPGMFQKIEDYTELLLPDYLLREGSVIEQMVTMIPEEDWTDQVQIIGWLYQYYNTEPKDKVFADLKKNIKITKESIPAATQLFTPDWIVHYMVENSLGRLWLEGHPNDAMKSEWKYYLDEAKQEPEVEKQLAEIRKEYAALKPEEIKVIDPCCGSGHILCVLFDVLARIYEDYGYTAREAAVKIVENNLWGLDIDERAAQLSYFAVMMKARKYDRRFFTRKVQPHVYAIHETNAIKEKYEHAKGNFRLSEENRDTLDYLMDAFTDAKEYGSIIQPKDRDYEGLKEAWETAAQQSGVSLWHNSVVPEIMHLIEQVIALYQKYHVVVTNPPYMGSSSMNVKLSEFVKENYPDGKSDLFACFIERGNDMVKQYGYNCMVTMQSWMFLSSFEKMREKTIKTRTITNLMHMENMVMGIAFGTAVTAFWNSQIKGYKGTYNQIKLADIQNDIPVSFPVEGNRFAQVSTDNFSKIPGAPVVYWVSDAFIKPYAEQKPLLGDAVAICAGLATGNNDLFQRMWTEVEFKSIGFGINDVSQTKDTKYKWYPCNSGGEFRKWYPADFIIVNWEADGRSIKSYKNTAGNLAARPQNTRWYFKEGFTWNKLSSSKFAVRYKRSGFIFDDTSRSAFPREADKLFYYIGLLCSNITFTYLQALDPTMSFTNGDLKRIPMLYEADKKEPVEELVKRNIELSREDWDSFETSWDFIAHPFVKKAIALKANNESLKIENVYTLVSHECNERFNELKNNEEQLNRLFIDIFGFDGGFDFSVDNDDITISLPELQSDIKSFISYAVGCMFGRYSLDVPGLAYAGGKWDVSKYTTFPPDKDAIIPICDDEYFEDDIAGRFVKFVETVFGKETLEENLRFISDALGGRGSSHEVIRSYFINDFYADHVKVYQKRPIYWLFDSGRKNGFKCLIYMHRYRPDTIARIRTDYVHEQQSRYRTAIKDIEQRMDGVSTAERVRLSKQLAKLTDQAEELRLYEEKIHHLADQMIDIDLDDGVKVNYAKFQDVLAKIK